jgi:hypothetical protein
MAKKMKIVAEVWADEFGTMPVDAGDIVSNPRLLAAFADTIPFPAAWLTARIVGRRIERLMGDAVMKIPTHRSQSQKWGLRSSPGISN